MNKQNEINFFKEIEARLSQIFDEKLANIAQETFKKDDQSLVTSIDRDFSDIIKKTMLKREEYRDFSFYSEEDKGELTFPSIILDPIDGTIELTKLIPECALSLAIMRNTKIDDAGNDCWLYNPFLKTQLSSFELKKREPLFLEQPLGLVSKTEWGQGLFKEYLKESRFLLRPVGSIAYKLMLLSMGLCDFVVTLRDKNIWDIAGGSILLSSYNINLYNVHGKIEELNESLIEGPLLWCHERNYSKLKPHFFKIE